MKIKQITPGTNQQLTTSMLDIGAAIYEAHGDFTIKSTVILPKGSELRLVEGSITVIGATLRQNGVAEEVPILLSGVYMHTSDQTDGIVGKYTTLCLTGAADLNKSLGEYLPVDSVIMRPGDYISNRVADEFEIRVTGECRVILPKILCMPNSDFILTRLTRFRLMADVISSYTLKIAILSVFLHVVMDGR